MSDLRKANLLSSHQGTVKPTLVKPPSEISLFDIYQAIDVNHHLFHVDPNTNQNCIVGKNIQPVLQHVYGEIEKDAEKKMKAITLQDIVKQINQQIADHTSSSANTN